jgi:hypothetical protein
MSIKNWSLPLLPLIFHQPKQHADKVKQGFEPRRQVSPMAPALPRDEQRSD